MKALLPWRQWMQNYFGFLRWGNFPICGQVEWKMDWSMEKWGGSHQCCAGFQIGGKGCRPRDNFFIMDRPKIELWIYVEDKRGIDARFYTLHQRPFWGHQKKYSLAILDQDGEKWQTLQFSPSEDNGHPLFQDQGLWTFAHYPRDVDQLSKRRQGTAWPHWLLDQARGALKPVPLTKVLTGDCVILLRTD